MRLIGSVVHRLGVTDEDDLRGHDDVDFGV